MHVEWWGIALLLLAPLVVGWLLGVIVADALTLRDLRRAGEHRRETRRPPPGV